MLALVGTGLEAVLCLLLLVRRSYREFPIFFAMSALSVIATIVLLMRQQQHRYYSVMLLDKRGYWQ